MASYPCLNTRLRSTRLRVLAAIATDVRRCALAGNKKPRKSAWSRKCPRYCGFI
uniref:Truncated thymidine kinase n=1 Tax=Human herpesvirus 1 TaxID=10298 RepID=C0L321_HHV1|nr:truncated thymidine kinase [Human alphaherpesvirus 1]